MGINLSPFSPQKRCVPEESIGGEEVESTLLEVRGRLQLAGVHWNTLPPFYGPKEPKRLKQENGGANSCGSGEQVIRKMGNSEEAVEVTRKTAKLASELLSRPKVVFALRMLRVLCSLLSFFP